MAQNQKFSDRILIQQQRWTKSFFRLGICFTLWVGLLAAGPSLIIAQTTHFVDADATGANDGTSWADAYTFLQDALAAASSGDQIWVAEGVYYPDEGTSHTDNDRTATFQLITGVEIYGGFNGTEGTLEARDWESNTTILSGDIDGNDDSFAPGVDSDDNSNTPSQTDHIKGNNAYSVLTGSANDETAIIDGFLIISGVANGTTLGRGGGGGMTTGYDPINPITGDFLGGAPTVVNVTFSGNYGSRGGGIGNYVGSHPSFKNVTISHNVSNERGGGVDSDGGSNPVLTNVTISNNIAAIGGGMSSNGGSAPVLNNVLISDNETSSSGGGMFNLSGSPSLTNVSITNNSAGTGGGGMDNSFFSSPTLNNVIIWNNKSGDDLNTPIASINNSETNLSISNSLIGGSGGSASWNSDLGTDGGNNIDADPLFADPTNGDYTLTNKSPAINTGDNTAIPAGVTTDLAGNPRVFDGAPDPDIVDMGAYEFQANPFATPDQNNVLFVDQNVSGGDGSGSSWDNAIPELRDALSWAGANWDGNADGTLQIWVADGLYLPTDDDTYSEATFQLVNNVEVYGGFAGSETTLNDRDWDANPAILSGDIDGNDTTTDGVVTDTDNITGSNSFNVVTGSGTDATASLDGFTITAAKNQSGFGEGGGMVNVNGSPTLANVTISGNNSFGKLGGGMCNIGNSNPVLTNVTFSGNSAPGSAGGGMGNEGSSPTLTNVTFSGNSASNGGGMSNSNNSSPTLTNVILWGNTAPNRPEIYNSSANPTISYSLIKGSGGSGSWNSAFGTDGGNNIDTDPLFADPENGDYTLTNNSPAINAGNNAANTTTTDLAGNDRIYDGFADPDMIDMGAYEFQGDPFGTPNGNNVLFVDQNVSGGDGSGSSWDNAIPKLRDAMDWAANEWDGSNPPLHIWVAEGRYIPTDDDTDRTATFQLANDVEIYGGFAGGESSLGERNWDANPTILSGDIDGNDTTTDGVITDTDNIAGSNSYHVVTGSGTDATSLLNGFMITGGQANGNSGDNASGGGMHNRSGSPKLANLTFIGNTAGIGNSVSGGGGIFNINNSSPILTNVIFSGNNSLYNGGGLFNQTSNPILNNVTFSRNSAQRAGGGMLSVIDSNPTLTNVVFHGNTAATGDGGGMVAFESSILTNVMFVENSAGNNGGGMSNSGNATLTNVIIWGNTATNEGSQVYQSGGTLTVNYSIVQNGANNGLVNENGGSDTFGTGTGNLDIDPQFTDLSNGDYSLTNKSPAINAGDPSTDLSLFPGGPTNPVDLAGNPRVYDGNPDPDVIDIGAYEFQEEPFMPEAGDNRILLANNSAYSFTPADFGQTENNYVVVIENLPVDFHGALELDGSVVSSGDEISVGDIDAGKLIYMPLAESYGYGYDNFDFSVEDNLGNASDESYTMSLDVAATSVQLTGGEGWRFLSSPVIGETIGAFFDPIWTQGFPGSDSPGASFVNIQTNDPDSYSWFEIQNADTDMIIGSGVIAYVYSNDDNSGAEEGFPKTLSSSTTNWFPLDGTVALLGAPYDDLQDGEADNNQSFFLIGNPHPIAIDFCGTQRANIANNLDMWAPNLNDGDYINLSCSTGAVEIAPYQSFWLRITDDNNSMLLITDSFMSEPIDGYFKQSTKDKNEDLFMITMNVTGGQDNFSNRINILFDEKASIELDELDAPKLSPSGLTKRYLSFYSLGEDDHSYALQSLPGNFGEKLRIPLDIQTTESGRFILDWTLPKSYLFSGAYYLKDNQTGEVMELREGSTYNFTIDKGQAVKTITDEIPAQANPKLATRNTNPEYRFELLIAASGVDGLTELGAVPEEFTLAQNYPNPFNPTTVISYQLPVSSEVRLEVYDMLGRSVATLVNEQVVAGRHTVNFDASNLSSGVYLYRLQAGSQIMTRKLTVVK